MGRIALTTRRMAVVSLMILSVAATRAGAAGVYENAAAEPAFLLSPRRTALTADFDFSRNSPIDATVYRVGAALPVRKAFMVALEQDFVSVSDTTDIQSGIGNLTVRTSARVWGAGGRAVMLLGNVVTGTTKQEYFPYSSKTLDIMTSAAYVDTLGDATFYGVLGRTWVNRNDTERPVDVRHNDCWRASAGAIFGGGDVQGQGGTLYEYTVDHAQRWIWYGAASVIATDEMVLRASLQFETAEEAQRVSDWAASVGFIVRF